MKILEPVTGLSIYFIHLQATVSESSILMNFHKNVKLLLLHFHINAIILVKQKK